MKLTPGITGRNLVESLSRQRFLYFGQIDIRGNRVSKRKLNPKEEQGKPAKPSLRGYLSSAKLHQIGLA
jgi:hypothetical protein